MTKTKRFIFGDFGYPWVLRGTHATHAFPADLMTPLVTSQSFLDSGLDA